MTRVVLPLIFTIFLTMSMAIANPETSAIDIREVIESEDVRFLEVLGNGYSSGAALEGVLQNESDRSLRISTVIGAPLFFSNRGGKSRQDMIATQIYLGDGGYLIEGEESFIELPIDSSTKVMLIAYGTDVELDNPKSSDKFSMTDTPEELLAVAETIKQFEAKHADLDTTVSSQIALWISKGTSVEKISEKFEFSEQDLSLAWQTLNTSSGSIHPKSMSIVWDTSWPWCLGRCLIDDISFSNAYPKAFYKTDMFTYGVIAASVATAATVTVMTAGAGAPAVVPGTSSLIVLVGGGGQGAYMAGLSTIGSLIGSNAVGGAAIINAAGMSIGLSPFAKSVPFGGLVLKTMFGVTAAAYDGILIGQNKETDQLTFATELRLPTDLGSKWVQQLADDIYEHEQKAATANDKDNSADFERFLAYQQADLRRGITALEACFAASSACVDKDLTRDDLIALSVMAYRAGRFDLFHEAIAFVKTNTQDFDGSLSFLNYLYATSLLMQSKFDDVPNVLLDSIDAEPSAIEPALLYIVFLAHTGFADHESQIESRVRLLQAKFDDDGYETGYSLASVYFRLGTIYATNNRHIRAIQYFGQARDELQFTQKWPIFSEFMNQQFRQDIELAMANSYYLSGRESKAIELFTKLYESEPDEMRRDVLTQGYVGSETY